MLTRVKVMKVTQALRNCFIWKTLRLDSKRQLVIPNSILWL